MKWNWRGLATLCCPALVGALALPAHGDENGRFYGMLRSRDLTPFGFLRLDMRPAHAVSIEKHTFAFELDLGYQNTWALSQNVEDYLKSIEATGRRRELGPAEIETIRNLPGEKYLFDLESATLDLVAHYKISSQWTAYAIATAVSYQGGFLDSSIEGFHDILGLNNYGRNAIARNGAHLIYDLRQVHDVVMEVPRSPGFLDPTFGLRYSGIKLPREWEMSVEMAIKWAFDGERPLLSTGRDDYGMQVSVRRLGERNALHVDLAAVYYAGEDTLALQEPQVIPTIVVGWERKMSARTNMNLQAYASQSVYGPAQTSLEELLKDKFQLSLGVRHRFDCCLVTFAVTENIQYSNNTPDIGFQAGFAWVPRLAPQ